MFLPKPSHDAIPRMIPYFI